jgi:hypothetical protein
MQTTNRFDEAKCMYTTDGFLTGLTAHIRSDSLSAPEPVARQVSFLETRVIGFR